MYISQAIIRADGTIKPIINLIDKAIKESKFTRSDETSYKIISRNTENNKNSCRNSYIWCFSTGLGYAPAYRYVVGPGRDKKVVQDYLGTGERYLMCDGYSCYDNLEGVKKVNCGVHIVRNFKVLEKNGDASTKPLSSSMIELFKQLFHVEDIIQDTYQSLEGMKKYNAIKEERIKRETPLTDKIKEYAELLQKKVIPKSKLGKAVNYLLKEWDSFLNI